MLWPPIRYSYGTTVKDLDVPSPAAPSWHNPLGTDDQARDVLARVIYGFRLSVLFGFTLTALTSVVGVIAGALQGFYGGLTDLLGQRFIEIWSGMPELYLLIILGSLITPGFWVLLIFLLLFRWMNLTGVVRAEFLRGRNLNTSGRRKRWVFRHHRYVASHPAERHGGDPDLRPVSPVRLGNVAIDARLSGFWPAAGIAIPWRTRGAGESEPASALARHHRFHCVGWRPDIADLHWRGGA